MQTQNGRVIDLFFVVPAIPAAFFTCLMILKYPPRTISDGVAPFGMLFFFAYLAASAHMLVLGIPAFLLGKRLDAIRWWSCIIVGFVIGSLPMAIWMQGEWVVFVPWGLFGAIGGLAFWLLWRFWIRFDQQVRA